MRVLAVLTLLAASLAAQEPAVPPGKSGFGKPALIAATDLTEFAKLPEDRRKLIQTSLEIAKNSPWLRYMPEGSDPAQGGFDCSGATYYVLRQCGLDPPRSSAGQLSWLKQHSRLQSVPADAAALDHPAFRKLRPGDLLFWARPGEAGAEPRIHHVAIYLGTETKDGLAVMINSTDGRSYRGVKSNGYGVYDLRVPKAGSGSVLIGYGTPPGIGVLE